MSELEREQTGGFLTVSTHHVDVSQDILAFQKPHYPLHNVTLNKNRQFGDEGFMTSSFRTFSVFRELTLTSNDMRSCLSISGFRSEYYCT